MERHLPIIGTSCQALSMSLTGLVGIMEEHPLVGRMHRRAFPDHNLDRPTSIASAYPVAGKWCHPAAAAASPSAVYRSSVSSVQERFTLSQYVMSANNELAATEGDRS